MDRTTTLYPRLLLLVGAATLVIGMTMAFTVGRTVTALALEVAAENLEASLSDRTTELSAASADPVSLPSAVEEMWGSLGRQPWVLGAEGRVLARGGSSERSTAILREAEGLLTSRATASNTNIQQRRVLAATKLASGEIFALEYHPTVTQDRRRLFLWIPASALAAALACSLLFSWFLARPIHRRLDRLRLALRQYGAGKKGSRLPAPKRANEFSSVYESFNDMADRIAELEESEQQRRQQQRTLLAGLAHDINTPMTVIRGYAEVLLDSDALEDEHVDIVSDLAAQSLYVQALVDDLLTIAQRNERIELAYEPVLLDDLIDSLVDTFAPAAARRRLALFGDGQGLQIQADPFRLRQMLTNLIRNALVHGRGATAIELSARQEGSSVVLTVRDDGPGVPAEQIPTLFKEFRRGEGASASGWGLGLAIVKLLAGWHAGTVRYLEAAEGACFELTLPLDPRES